ncbi:MAG: hypothetical protein EIB84_05560 [Spiroplasma poulsonii]|uniref:hypothetical protein n=1 Tax=Spiroplasma poulsonii TaxID=2138 RepID=UPI0010575D9F|nr:hypothetical protein [Spiroplasma poulsonii]MBW1242246.1 hypothetical protein [Spiroplasma poulsonii]
MTSYSPTALFVSPNWKLGTSIIFIVVPVFFTIASYITTFLYIRLLALLVKKLQIFVKKILIEKYNFN